MNRGRHKKHNNNNGFSLQTILSIVIYELSKLPYTDYWVDKHTNNNFKVIIMSNKGQLCNHWLDNPNNVAACYASIRGNYNYFFKHPVKSDYIKICIRQIRTFSPIFTKTLYY